MGTRRFDRISIWTCDWFETTVIQTALDIFFLINVPFQPAAIFVNLDTFLGARTCLVWLNPEEDVFQLTWAFGQNAVTIFGENEIVPRNYKKEMRKIKLMLQVLNYILWTVCQGYIRALPWKLSNLSQLWTTSLRKFINFNKITDRCNTIWRKIISGFLFGFT